MFDICPLCGFDCRGKKGGTTATLSNFPLHVTKKHPEVVNKLVAFEGKARLLNIQAKKETGLFLMFESYWSHWKDLATRSD